MSVLFSTKIVAESLLKESRAFKLHTYPLHFFINTSHILKSATVLFLSEKSCKMIIFLAIISLRRFFLFCYNKYLYCTCVQIMICNIFLPKNQPPCPVPSIERILCTTIIYTLTPKFLIQVQLIPQLVVNSSYTLPSPPPPPPMDQKLFPQLVGNSSYLIPP